MPHRASTLSRLAHEAASNGLWTIAPARALTLRPQRHGVVHIARGAAWATHAGPHEGTAEGGPQGDLLLEPGARLALRAGDTLVLEPIAVHGQPAHAVAFEWHEAAGLKAQAWQDAVARPASDLRRALGDAARAFARLAQGVLGWAASRLRPPASARILG